MNENQFVQWEQASQDTLDFKRIYVDMANDLISGLVLSEIVFWHLPNPQERSKLRAYHEGHYWVARPVYQWWDRVRITRKQAERALSKLEAIGLIFTDLFKFDGAPTTHVRLNWPVFLGRFQHVLDNPPQNPHGPSKQSQRVKSISTKGVNPLSPKGEMLLPESGESLTEITTENTTEKDNGSGDPAMLPLDTQTEKIKREKLQEDVPTKMGKKASIPDDYADLERFICEQLGWFVLSQGARETLSKPSRCESANDMPSPNELFGDQEQYKNWILDEVIPWWKKGKKKGGSAAFVGALAKYDWFTRWLSGEDNAKPESDIKAIERRHGVVHAPLPLCDPDFEEMVKRREQIERELKGEDAE